MMIAFYGLTAAFVIWYVIPYVIRRAGALDLLRRCKRQRVICLSYDDGPSSSLTPEVIRLLNSYGAKATFFMLGSKLAANQEAVSLVVDGGHEIGCHSYDHRHAWKTFPVTVYQDIRQGMFATRQIGATNLFRPPFGKVTAGTLLQVWLSDFRLGWWTVDSSDTWKIPKTIDRVLQKIRDAGGGVVLLHDNARADGMDIETFVVDLTKAILEMAKNEHYRVCKMTDI